MKQTLQLALLAMPLLFGCNKKETVHPAQPATAGTTTVLAAKETTTSGPKINTTLDTQGPDKGWCAGWPTNCVFLGGVDVGPTLKLSLDLATVGGPIVVGTVFRSPDAQILAPYLGEDMMQKLKSGSRFLAKSNDCLTGASYMIGTSLIVTPNNMEMAFQIEIR